MKDCCKVRLHTTRVRTVACSVCHRATVSSKWTCTCGVPWIQCSIHRRLGFACGTAALKRRQFAVRSRAQAHHQQIIKYKNATRLGALGAGHSDKARIYKKSAQVVPPPPGTMGLTVFMDQRNSAIMKKIKKNNNGMGAIAPRRGDAQAGGRKQQVNRNDCDTGSHYQQHLREALFPSQPK